MVLECLISELYLVYFPNPTIMRARFLALLPATALRYFQLLAGILLIIHLLILFGVLPKDIV
ncbi:MAG TPA: hypothetical protein DCE41_32630 [Cytophagales bacterium]|nr:hypothetical protein [Cytophagales bacterium]HAP64427.1 hypothetical protein [Cytophagales bacterium]